MASGAPETRRRRANPSPAQCTAFRLVAFGSGLALGMNLLLPAASARPLAEPGPSAKDVERSERQVRERAAEVGRTKAKLAQADGELDRLAIAAASAVERYNGEQLKLRRAQRAYTDTQGRLSEAHRRVEISRAELASFAAQVYRDNTGYDPLSSAVAGEGGPQGFMDRAGMVKMLAERRAAMVQSGRGGQDGSGRVPSPSEDDAERTERCGKTRRCGQMDCTGGGRDPTGIRPASSSREASPGESPW